MKFRPDSDERACGAETNHGELHGSFACLRTAGHSGEHIALMCDAARADGVCFGCRERTGHQADCLRRKPHGKDCPHRCSMCLGATPKHITIVDHQLCEDGRPVGRQVDDERRQVTARKTARFRRRAM